DVRLLQLLRIYIDGIPLDLASKLLPKSTYLSPALLIHIHMHAKSQNRYADSANESSGKAPISAKVSKTALLGILDNLKNTISGLKWQLPRTEWGEYYANTNYTDQAFIQKKALVKEFFNRIKPTPQIAWDLGANCGEFSRCI